MKRILILLVTFFSFYTVKADCMACWVLRKVEVTLTDGTILKGYVQWNESRISESLDFNKWQNKFPESLVPYYKNLPYKRDLILIQEIFFIKNDSIGEIFASKKECLKTLDLNQIKTVKELDKNAKRLEGVGEILTFTQDEINKLKTNPIATMRIEIEPTDVYFISYNPEIDRRQLNKINIDNCEEKEIELKQKGVIVYIIGYD